MSKKRIISLAEDYARVAEAINGGTYTIAARNGVTQIGVHRPDDSAVGIVTLDKQRSKRRLRNQTRDFAKACGL